MPYFSRLGTHDTARLDKMFFSQGGEFAEYWAHEATVIRTEDWPLWRWRMARMRNKYSTGWFADNRRTVEWVRAQLADRGPLRPAEIEQDDVKRPKGSWWEWSAVKRSLELMFHFGDVTIAGRKGFERRYALSEHIFDESILSSEVSEEDAIRELIRRAARHYGIFTQADVSDYFRIRSAPLIKRVINELVDEGEIIPASVEGWDSAAAYVHRDAVIPRRKADTRLLSPFDPVVWFRPRAERLYDFHYRIEIYTPAHKRQHGYYCLPVLIDETIGARVDLKADRQTSTLLVQSAWWENNHGAANAEGLARELERAAEWQGLESVSVSGWGTAAADLAHVWGSRTKRHEHDREKAIVLESGSSEEL